MARPASGGKKAGWREPGIDGKFGSPSLRASTKRRVEQAEQHRELREQVCPGHKAASYKIGSRR